jgi:hypothetical protein
VRSGRDDHHVGAFRQHEVPRRLDSEPALDAELLHLPCQEAHDPGVVRAVGCPRRDEHLAADLGLALHEDHAVAAEARHPRGLEAGHPGAHDDDLLRDRRRAHLTELTLPARRGVLNAGHRLPPVDPVDTALVGTNAQADLVQATIEGLARQVGVRDEGARHPDHVDRAGGQDLVGVDGVHDPGRVEDRHARHRRLDRRGERQVEADGERHVGDRRRLESERVGAAADNGQEIDEARGGESPSDLGHVVGRETAGGPLVPRHPDADHVVPPHLTADLPEHLEAEAHPVLEAPPVLVGPLVEERRPELVHEVVVGEGQLDAVEPPVATAPSGVAEGPDQHGDLLGLDLVRHLAVQLLRDLGGREEDVPASGVRLGSAAKVGELREAETAVAVDGVGERPVSGNDRVVVVRDQVPLGGGGRGMHAR